MNTRLFSKPICAKEERNGPPSANQGLSMTKLRSSHALCTLCVHRGVTDKECQKLSQINISDYNIYVTARLLTVDPFVNRSTGL